MVMTNEEIVREYREAKNRMAQIGILADQNVCKKQDIVAVLLEAGIEDIPKQFLPKKKVETPEHPAVLIPAPSRKDELAQAAFETITQLLPDEGCNGGEALNFVGQVHALLKFMEALMP